MSDGFQVSGSDLIQKLANNTKQPRGGGNIGWYGASSASLRKGKAAEVQRNISGQLLFFSKSPSGTPALSIVTEILDGAE